MGNLSIWLAPNVSMTANISLWRSWASYFFHLSHSKPSAAGANLMTLCEIEECFRIMKTEFKARPIFLHREDRIKAYFLTCFIALFIFRILKKKLDEKYTCEEIIKTLHDMTMYRPGEKMGYLPSYTRTDLTDALHEELGFQTDYEILTDISMKRFIRNTKKK